jgi:4-amino-4-deoxy-L-arabinose transferase-like glycosyltransferase
MGVAPRPVLRYGQRGTCPGPVVIHSLHVAGALQLTATLPGIDLPPAAQPNPTSFWRFRPGWRHVAVVERRFIVLLLLIVLAKGIILTFVHAPYSGHDEVAHYAYLQMVAEEGRIPVLPELAEWREVYRDDGEYSHDRIPGEFWDYCRRATIDWSPGCQDPRFENQPIYAMSLAGDYFPTGWIYTANHPPLYYLLMSPVHWLTSDLSIEGQLYALRLAAIPFGLLTVVMAWLTVRTLFGGERFLTLMVPTFVAFQPQISYEAAMLNNDILAIAFTSVVVYGLVRGLKQGFPIGTVALIGFFYGLAILSKNTSLTTGGIIAFAMVFGIGARRWREWLAKGTLAAGVAAAMVWPWYLYLWRTYGDFTGLARIRELQYWNYDGSERPTVWAQLVSKRFFFMRWRETWGEFGWRLIPLGDPEARDWWLLRVLLLVSMLAALGIAVWAIRLQRRQHAMLATGDHRPVTAPDPILDLQRWQVVGVLTMGMTCLLAYFAILQFGTTFSLTQARYYFPAIVPAAILFVLGLRAVIPRRWLTVAGAGLLLGLAILNVVIYTAYVLPYWSTVGVDPLNLPQFYR